LIPLLGVEGLIFFCTSLPSGMLAHPHHFWVGGIILGIAGIILGQVLECLTSSRTVAVAVTTSGFILFRRSPNTFRTGRIIERLHPVAPVVEDRTFGWRKVAIADRTLWVGYRSDPLMGWPSGSLPSAGSHARTA
jgi:hypothetical protein